MSGIYDSVPASPEEVEAFAQSLTPAHLRCRVYGHDPIDHNTVYAKDVEGHPDAYFDVAMICTHECGVRWRVLADASGYVVSRRLDYSGAPDYLSTVGRVNTKYGRAVVKRVYFNQRVSGRKPRSKGGK